MIDFLFSYVLGGGGVDDEEALDHPEKPFSLQEKEKKKIEDEINIDNVEDEKEADERLTTGQAGVDGGTDGGKNVLLHCILTTIYILSMSVHSIGNKY